jgi:hypothetical protein
MLEGEIMNPEYTDAQQAEGKILLTVTRLVAKYPFHARILELCRRAVRPEVGTVDVTVSSDAIFLLYNPAFVLDTNVEELGGALLQLVHHVLLGQFPELSPMESTSQRYRRLKTRKRRPPIIAPGVDSADGAQRQKQEASQSVAKTRRTTTRGKTRAHKAGRSPESENLRAVDCHAVWQEARQDVRRSEAVIHEVIRQAVAEVGLHQVPRQIRDVIETHGVGVSPGPCEQDLRLGRGQLNWPRILRRFVGRELESRPMYNRPPRRFPDLVGIVPGQRRQQAKPRIMAVIDTSGSMSRSLLERISGELARLARRFCVKVVECDEKVRRTYDFRPLTKVVGRGGTDFRPPLKRAFLRKHRPDLILFFTDGHGPAPARPPGRPLIWCLTDQGQRPADWGQAIWMADS